MGCYMRWVQFKNGHELIAKYDKAGYPTRELKTYSGVTIVGFPTKPTICDVVPPEDIVYAGDATPQEQYQFLRLLEKYWIGERGNQISYTLKYKPENTTV
jgi:ribonucleoside-triphosphate reductase (formate)